MQVHEKARSVEILTVLKRDQYRVEKALAEPNHWPIIKAALHQTTTACASADDDDTMNLKEEAAEKQNVLESLIQFRGRLIWVVFPSSISSGKNEVGLGFLKSSTHYFRRKNEYD